MKEEIPEKTYQELMELIFRDKYKLIGVTTEMKKVKKPNVFDSYSIYKLSKDDKEISVKVKDELSFDFAFHHEYLPDELDGKTFIKIDNKKRYYDDVELIAKDFDNKINESIKRLQKGEIGDLDFIEIDKLLEEFILTPNAVLNHKFESIKLNYHIIYARLILEAQNYLSVYNQAKSKNVNVKKYGELLDKLSINFFKNKNPMQSYRLFKNIVEVDANRLAEKSKQQAQYIHYLFKGGAAISPLPLEISFLQILDAYRRATELVRNSIRDIRRIIQLELNVTIDSKELKYDEDVDIIRKKEKYKELVDAIEPIVRHSESHLFTRIDKDKRFIYIQDDIANKKFEFSPQNINNNRKELITGFIPALLAFYAGTDIALKLVTMRSKNFLYRLILVGNTKK
jgi:hypothetical protein